MRISLKLFLAPAIVGLFCFMAFAALSCEAQAKNEKDGKRHPSYSLLGRDKPAPDSPLNPNFVVADEARLSEKGFWRSSYIPESLVGLVVDDIDGDGRNEVAYASEKNVYVTRVNGGKLTQLAKFTVQKTEKIVSLDAIKLSGGRAMDVVISAQHDDGGASSYILKYDGSSLTPMNNKRIMWYLRVVGSGGGKTLIGQKSGTNYNEHYSGKVHRMNFNGSDVSPAGSVALPTKVNVFSYTTGVLGTNRTNMTAAIKYPSEHIFLFENGRDRAWESREEYGGTMNYIRPYGPSEDAGHATRDYLPARMIIADIDQDGVNELIVAKNDRGGVSFMSNLRAFTGGAIQAFKYSNMALNPFFRTRALPGPAVDIQVGDFNNNGSIDLVAAVVVDQKSGMLKDGRSVIVAYELGVSRDSDDDKNDGKKTSKGKSSKGKNRK